MKALLCLTLIMTFGLRLSAQQVPAGEYIRESRELIKNGRYMTAIEVLEEVLVFDENNVEACYEMGNALRLSFEYERAEAFYQKVVYLDPKRYPLSVYYMALMAKYNGNYQESVIYFTQFIDRWNSTSKYPVITEQAHIERAGSEMALLHREKLYFQEELLGFNSKFNDYAPATNPNGGIIITSSRVTRQNKAVDQRFGEALSEQYYFQPNVDGYLTLDDSIRRLNTRYNDGSGCFSDEGDTYYFTICGYKVDNCRIFVSTRQPDGTFSSPEPLPEHINQPKTDNKQPGITGDTLYFVSNRKGGYGGNDIWYTVKSKDHTWSIPQNLGTSVNSPMNENSPRPVMSNMLLFASDGHQGFGGMDMFLARKLASGDTTLVNVGIPFNSSRDDMFPDLTNEQFLWSSNKPGGTGGFDIYKTKIESKLDFTSLVSVVNIDARRSNALPVPHEIRDPVGTYITIVNSGELTFEQLPPDQQQTVDALALGRDAELIVFNDLAMAQIDRLVTERKAYFEDKNKRKIQVFLDAQEVTGTYNIDGTITCDYCNFDPVVEILDSIGNPMHTAVPDDSGQFRFSNLAAAQTVYLQVQQKEGGIASFENISADFQPDHVSFTYLPVYFNLAESQMRPESRTIIRDVASFLRQHQDVHVEIIAHADNTGSATYNEVLSQKRGAEVLKSLLAEDVRATSIMVRARGFNDPRASNETPLGRQLNRRVEFQFTGPAYELDQSYHYCFTRERMTGEVFNEMLESHGLNEMNASARQESVRAFYPVLTRKELPQTDLLECSPSHPGK